ncbi:MAG: thiamine pyrophosphate-dependent enzyme [Syntrophobacteraceae bacterium]
METRQILLGNEAIALGLLESACTVATSYPGTPASEILATLVRLKERDGLPIHLEWSINEKVAFEVALTNSFVGRRSAVIMKQVGLNVAADPLMSAAYTGVKGGFVLIVADDPGPHSSQTEQDSRMYAMMAKIPVLDPTCPEHARDLVCEAFRLSERYEVPVMLRSTTRVCHARQDLELRPFGTEQRPPVFDKDPTRWAATPKFRLSLHHKLNEKIAGIGSEPSCLPLLVNEKLLRDGTGHVSPDASTSAAGRRLPSDAPDDRVAIVASGVALAHTREVLGDLGLLDAVPLYGVPMPYPLPPTFSQEILSGHDRILVLEETDPVIELQLRNREKVSGRINGTVPSAGELLPEGVERILRGFVGLPALPESSGPSGGGRRPTLCAGCPHRAAFFAIKKAFPKGIYPGDIGCYTLGLNLGAVDTVLCMGAAISQASGFYHAFKAVREDFPPICATIGDSTFYHAGIPPLINAVVQGARFVLVILDNSTTAMTGHQPTPAAGRTLNGTAVPSVSIPALVKACGVKIVEEVDPYDLKATVAALKKAGKHVKSEAGTVAVVIARRPCLMDRKQVQSWARLAVAVNEKCEGCHFCIQHFECPALVSTGEKQPIQIDAALCSGCGVCVQVCPHKALEARENARDKA